MEFLFTIQHTADEAYVQGEVTIYINDELFYTNKSINVFELAQKLAHWLVQIKRGEIAHFMYASDEHLLQFFMQKETIRVESEQQSFQLSFETVQQAALRYCMNVQIELARSSSSNRLDEVLQQLVSENKWALILFESRQYDEAFAIIVQLAKQKPSVESLTNYAYILLHEEDDYAGALSVLQQVLPLQPQTDFPYLLLGELSIHFKRFEEAKLYLQKALQFRVSNTVYHNLGIVYFALHEFERAAHAFSNCTGDSGLAQLNEVVSWMRAGQEKKAIERLNGWNEEAADYTGAIEIADVYIELGCFNEARVQFEKEWQSYYVSSNLVSRYAFTLYQLGDMEACQQIVNAAIIGKKEEIKDEQASVLDEHWSESERDERIMELQNELEQIYTLIERLQQGFIPPFDFEMYPAGGCQLFGCPLHRHPEYEELVK